MDAAKTAQATQLLAAASRGDVPAVDRLSATLYDELHAMAAAQLQRERAGHTLQPTDLINETFVRLLGDVPLGRLDRVQFFGIAASSMRRVLVDHARSRNAQKRGGCHARVTLHSDQLVAAPVDLDVVALDEALILLERIDPRQCRIVELRFFAGLTVEDVATLLNVSKRTVENEWSLARAWLRRSLVGHIAAG
ncbi:MAG: ECF-type sigma factor [Planctomycetota bacterium]